MVDYRITVKTSDIEDAGTDANVYITLIGISGNSGERQLDNDENNFEKNKTDLFRISANGLGDLSQVRIRHDDKNDYSGWHLEYITVQTETENPQKTWTFPCNRWLATDEDDGAIDRTLSRA